MSVTDELTFIQKIEKYRIFAHRPVSSSDSSSSSDQGNKSAGSPNESNNSFGDGSSSTNGQENNVVYSGLPVGPEHGATAAILDSNQRTGMNSISAELIYQPNGSAKESEGEASEDGEPTSPIGFNPQTVISDTSSESETGLEINQHKTTDFHCPGTLPEPSNDDHGVHTEPGDLFYINDNTSQLMAFKSIDELSRYLNETKPKSKENNQNKSLMKPVLGMSTKTIVNHVSLGEYIRKLHASDQLVDVIIDVRGEKFPAHRVVLCSQSLYFSNLFAQTKSKKIPFDLKIKGISAHAFASFLEFCYTGEITVYPDIAADLLIVADYLQVKQLKKRCALIAGSLPIDQAVKFVVNSRPSTTHKLYTSLFEHVLKHFEAATKFDEFLEMDVETLCLIIASDELVVQTELAVFQAVVRWIVHNIEDRVKYTMRIMALIRFGHMTSRELHTCAETTSLIRGYDKFREIILIANWQISSCQLGREDPFNFPVSKPRSCFTSQTGRMSINIINMPPPLVSPSPKQTQTTTNQTDAPEVTIPQSHVEDILLISGCQLTGNKQTAEFVERYDTHDNQWAHFCKLPVSRKGHVAVALKDNLFLIGGSEPLAADENLTATETVYILNSRTKTWSRATDMPTARHSHCACVARGKIFVIGGKSRNNSVLKSVEYYDVYTDTWAEESPLNSPRYGACAATYSGKIFVTGGLGEDNDVPSTLPVINTVECYDIDKKTWTRLNNLRFPRCYSNLVCANDRLFLCCGATRSYNFRSSVLVSVASIDEYDVNDDVWTHVTDMVIPRHLAGVTVTGDRLYIFGGLSTAADRCLQSVECYHTLTGKWISGIADLPEPSSWIACVPVTSKWQTSPPACV